MKNEREVARRVRLLATLWTAAYQAPPSMGFSRQEYWSGVPLPSPITILLQRILKDTKQLPDEETHSASFQTKGLPSSWSLGPGTSSMWKRSGSPTLEALQTFFGFLEWLHYISMID